MCGGGGEVGHHGAGEGIIQATPVSAYVYSVCVCVCVCVCVRVCVYVCCPVLAEAERVDQKRYLANIALILTAGARCCSNWLLY